MIKVNRTDCPEILKFWNIPKSEGELETLDAIDFYSDNTNHTLPFKKTGLRGRRIDESYSVYSNKEVRKILKDLFHGKCAYCESKINSIYGGDIEHFRPKGRIKIGNTYMRPGYFWLSSDWSNLLFACPFCNQTNTHEILENGVIEEIILGKLDQFPLQTENFRLNHTHSHSFIDNSENYDIAFRLEESERLLLKPCTDDVEKFFMYEDDGRILPAEGLTDFEREMANTSITVYALRRIGLVQSREEKVIQIKAQIRRVEEAMINLNNHISDSNETKTWFEGILRRELIILHEYKHASKEYSGLARYILNQYFNNL